MKLRIESGAFGCWGHIEAQSTYKLKAEGSKQVSSGPRAGPPADLRFEVGNANRLKAVGSVRDLMAQVMTMPNFSSQVGSAFAPTLGDVCDGTAVAGCEHPSNNNLAF
jgi:hypothetical protein